MAQAVFNGFFKNNMSKVEVGGRATLQQSSKLKTFISNNDKGK